MYTGTESERRVSTGGTGIQQAPLFTADGRIITYSALRFAVPGAHGYALARQRRRPFVHAFVLSLIALGLLSSLFVSKTFLSGLNESGPIIGLALPVLGQLPSDEPVLMSAALPETVRRNDLAQASASLVGEAVELVEAEPIAELERTRPFLIYTIQERDTASAIAEQFGITLQYLLWNNLELRDEDFLSIGQQLFIPVDNGILHYVSLGETLSGVANFYSVTLDEIVGWEGNAITSPDQILEGELVFVLGGVLPPPIIEPPPAVVVAPPPPVAPPSVGAVSDAGLMWPFVGRISSYIGDGRGHRGIDIDGVGQHGAAIRAATSGTVIFAGGDACCSLGLYIKVLSPNGILTVYAHLSSLSVAQGQQVSQGDGLGIIGCTGHCTGTHLHFEVYDNGALVNPIHYLP